MAKKVSVVITSYNQKDYLFEALDSVLRQTYPVHEIIVADDHSTDGSIKFIKELSREFPDCVRPVLNPYNQGIPGNRNSGLEIVSGDYVFILDGDDRFLPSNIERMIAFLEANPDFKCVYSNLDYIDAQGNFLKTRDEEEQPSGDIFYEIAYGQFGILRNMIMDFRQLKRVGFLDKRFPRYDGFDLTVRLARQGRIGYIFESLAEYRVYPLSDSKGLKAIDHIRDLEGILKKMKPWWADLPEIQIQNLQDIWSRRMVNFYRDGLRENPASIRTCILPLVLIGKRYIKAKEYFKYCKLLRNDIKMVENPPDG
jgi:glycosyltransferase involved in cell wall biosynthesis